MKKIIILFISIIFLVGCKSNDNIDNDLYNCYQDYYHKLVTAKEFQDNLDECSIKLIVNEVDNEYRYDIIIDEVKIEMNNIKVIAYIDKDDKNIPSLGLLETNSFSLKPNFIDKSKGYYKGINLSGVTSKSDFVVKIYFTYENNEKNIERYVYLHGNASR